MRQISGNKLFVKALKEEDVEVLFGYPGACTIDISDELYKQSGIDVILPRHEQALVHEADAYARTTGKVGVCLVTSGPGATNLVTGLATANYDSVPLVCFTGQVARHLIGNDAFQEVDIVGDHTEHHQVWCDGHEAGRSWTDSSRRNFISQEREGRTGSDRSSERCDGGAWQCTVSERGEYQRI